MTLILMFIVGLAAGSFVNALVWRIRMQEKTRSKRLKQQLSIVNGRSMCVHCKHLLGVWDLIPVFSWLFLRGKCRYCHKPIDDNPVIELATGVLFALSFAIWPYGFNPAYAAMFAIWLMILTLFVAMFAYDLKWMILPDRLTRALVCLSLIFVLTRALAEHSLSTTAINAAWGFLLLGGLFYVLFQFSGGKWIGGGDVKLGFGLGILVGGPLPALLTLFLASLIGTLVSVPLLLLKKDKARVVPFGPFLLSAAHVVFVFEPQLNELASKYLFITI